MPRRLAVSSLLPPVSLSIWTIVFRSIASINVRFVSSSGVSTRGALMDKSCTSTCLPSHISTARCTSFCNWRTLPGQSNFRSISAASGV